MIGPVEAAIRDRVVAGARLPTPTGRATFLVAELSPEALVLLLGEKRARTPLAWHCLEEVPAFLHGRGWVRVGATRDSSPSAEVSTLDTHLKKCIKRQTADYVAVVLERAGIVDLDRDQPARVCLRL